MEWIMYGVVIGSIAVLIIECRRLKIELELIEFELKVLEAKIAWMKGGKCDE